MQQRPNGLGGGIPGDPGRPGMPGLRGLQGPQGSQGSQGSTGGPQGAQGSQGAAGATGAQGSQGATGSQGAQGATGAQGSQGPQGAAGATGAQGPQGSTGAQGSAGGLSAFGSFFATMPPDNAATIALGAPVLFPQDGPATGGIVRTGPGTFSLPAIGTYEIAWQASISEAGQLVLALNGVEVPNTTAGRATGTCQISNTVLITTSAINTTLEVRNPAGNAAALTVTPIAGGTNPASAWLTIKRIS